VAPSPDVKPTILLTGKRGQLGSELCTFLPAMGMLVALNRGELDLARPAAIRQTVRDLRPGLIVNAAAYTQVDLAEKDEAAAFAVNAEAPAVLAEEAKNLGAMLVHFSTDYVFDGSKMAPYLEEDAPNPLNTYGRSKLAGEQAIRASGAAHLIFRTSWVYAPRGRNFLLTILKLSTEREELRIVHDQIGAPTWSREIASGSVRILALLAEKGWNRDSFAAAAGTYHMTALGETSWHQFAQAILEESSSMSREAPWFAAATSGLPQITRRVTAITTAEYPKAAQRPAYSVLSNLRLQQSFGFQLPGWREQLHTLFCGG